MQDLANYLPRTARRTVWGRVLAELVSGSRSQQGHNLALVMANPLMVALARAIYSNDRAGDPAELLDGRRFPTPWSVQEHLLAAFIPAVLDHRRVDDGGARQPARRWPAESAQRWLSHLALHMNRSRTRDLAWWQLTPIVPRWQRMLVLAVAFGPVAGATLATAVQRAAAYCLAAGLGFGVLLGFRRPPPAPWPSRT